jgi:hypothetical protein
VPLLGVGADAGRPATIGIGSGKRPLGPAICLIAFGLRLAGFTPGKDGGELDKRINGELLEGGPALSIGKVNEAVLASPTLEGAMTERPFKVPAVRHPQERGARQRAIHCGRQRRIAPEPSPPDRLLTANLPTSRASLRSTSEAPPVMERWR